MKPRTTALSASFALAAASGACAFVASSPRSRPACMLPQHRLLSSSDESFPGCSLADPRSEGESIPEASSSSSSPSITSRRNFVAAFSGGFLGWVLGPRLAMAGGAYQPEESYSSLDLSLPSYTVEDTVGPGAAATAATSWGGGGGRQKPLADPAKEAERLASEERKRVAREAKEREKARAYYARLKAKEAAEADKERIRLEVEAGRAAMREERLRSKIPTD